MRETALLFGKVLTRPSEALGILLKERAAAAPAFLLFALYTLGSAAAAAFLPASFMPEAPSSVFGRPFAVYLLAGTAGGVITTFLCAVFLPRITAILSAGRIGPRLLLGLAAAFAYFAALGVLKEYPAALALAAIPPAAAAWYRFRAAGESFHGMLRVLLAAFAIGSAFLPLEGLAIYFSSSRLYELSTIAMALWYFIFLVKALRLAGGTGAPRAAAAVFLTMTGSALFLYNIALLLPEEYQALLLLF